MTEAPSQQLMDATRNVLDAALLLEAVVSDGSDGQLAQAKLIAAVRAYRRVTEATAWEA